MQDDYERLLREASRQIKQVQKVQDNLELPESPESKQDKFRSQVEFIIAWAKKEYKKEWLAQLSRISTDAFIDSATWQKLDKGKARKGKQIIPQSLSFVINLLFDFVQGLQNGPVWTGMDR